MVVVEQGVNEMTETKLTNAWVEVDVRSVQVTPQAQALRLFTC